MADTPVRVTPLDRLATILAQTFEGVKGWFSPGRPIEPVEPEPQPRVRQVQVGWNLQYQPRGTEVTSFAQLRYFADAYDVARIAISRIKDEMASLDWDIVARDKGQGDHYADAIRAARKFFERPDRENDWATWLGMLIEDRLVIDAVTIYPRRNRIGGLYALELIDGATIKPLVDLRGKTPDPPAPAYQQVLWGVPRGQWDRTQLLYLPANRRSHTPYGMSEIEYIILVVNMALRKRLTDLAHFTEGNIPEALLGVPDSWTPEQIREFQEFWDAMLAGDIRRRSRVIFTPAGGRGQIPVHEFRPFSGNPEFDLWLLKITCAALKVTPAEIGFTDDVNRATASAQENTLYRASIRPLSRYVKAQLDYILAEYMGLPDLEWQWIGGEAEDRLREAQIDEIHNRNGVLQLDEWREKLGLKPFGLPPFLMTGAGPILLEDLVRRAAQQPGDVPPTHGGPAEPPPPEDRPRGGGSEGEGPGGESSPPPAPPSAEDGQVPGGEAGDVATKALVKVIVHEDGKWVVYSHDRSKKLGTYDTKEEAEERLRQIEYFKHRDEEKAAGTDRWELLLRGVDPGDDAPEWVGEDDPQRSAAYQAARDDLRRWRTVAMKAVRQGAPVRAFRSEHIPLPVYAAVRRELDDLTAVAGPDRPLAVQRTFAKALALLDQAEASPPLPPPDPEALTSDEFAKALGWPSWEAAWRKQGPSPTPVHPSVAPAAAPVSPAAAQPSVQPPAGLTPSPGPRQTTFLGHPGHWVTIHGHRIFIRDDGHVHLHSTGQFHDPNDPSFEQHLRNVVGGTSTHLYGNRHVFTSPTTGGANPGAAKVHMVYTGSGWRLEVENRHGQIAHVERLATRQKHAAVQRAHELLTQHHADVLREYVKHHQAVVAAHQAAQAGAPSQATVPDLWTFHTQHVSYGRRQGNTIRVDVQQHAAHPGSYVTMTYYGSGWRLELRDAQGNILQTHRVQGRSLDYAKMAASMMLYRHHHGAAFNLPAGPAPAGTGASHALQHAGVAPTHRAGGAAPSTSTASSPAPTTAPPATPAQPSAPPAPPAPAAQPAQPAQPQPLPSPARLLSTRQLLAIDAASLAHLPTTIPTGWQHSVSGAGEESFEYHDPQQGTVTRVEVKNNNVYVLHGQQASPWLVGYVRMPAGSSLQDANEAARQMVHHLDAHLQPKGQQAAAPPAPPPSAPAGPLPKVITTAHLANMPTTAPGSDWQQNHNYQWVHQSGHTLDITWGLGGTSWVGLVRDPAGNTIASHHFSANAPFQDTVHQLLHLISHHMGGGQAPAPAPAQPAAPTLTRVPSPRTKMPVLIVPQNLQGIPKLSAPPAGWHSIRPDVWWHISGYSVHLDHQQATTTANILDHNEVLRARYMMSGSGPQELYQLLHYVHQQLGGFPTSGTPQTVTAQQLPSGQGRLPGRWSGVEVAHPAGASGGKAYQISHADIDDPSPLVLVQSQATRTSQSAPYEVHLYDPRWGHVAVHQGHGTFKDAKQAGWQLLEWYHALASSHPARTALANAILQATPTDTVRLYDLDIDQLPTSVPQGPWTATTTGALGLTQLTRLDSSGNTLITVGALSVGNGQYGVYVIGPQGTMAQHILPPKATKAEVEDAVHRIANLVELHFNPYALQSQAAPAPSPAPTASGGPYVPPPPRQVQLTPYAHIAARQLGVHLQGVVTSGPMVIDHRTVGNESNDVSALLRHPDWSGSVATSGRTIAHLQHGPTGLTVVARYRSATPSAYGDIYTIEIQDANGHTLATYDSKAARARDYIAERAAQVANWAVKNHQQLVQHQQQQARAANTGIVQFAAAHTSGRPPAFALDEQSWSTPSHHATVRDYLKNAFPKLIGLQQHAPHGGLDPIEHTLNVIDPKNLRTQGLSQRDAELLRLGMVFHDVGKQHGPLDHEHPRKSVQDAQEHLWDFGLTPQEHADVSTIIKWHDAVGDYLAGRHSLTDLAKIAGDERMADLLVRAWQSDVEAIPGFKGRFDVDRKGPQVLRQLNAEIQRLRQAGQLPARPPSTPPAQRSPAGQPRSLVAPGLRYGELVQKTGDFHVGPPTPYGSTPTVPREVYDEAKQHPELNFARAFGMAYDGPTGHIIKVYHGTSDMYVQGIAEDGLRPGTVRRDNVFGHGIYAVVNGADNARATGYAAGAIVVGEYHTGRSISLDDLQRTVLPRWRAAHPTLASKLTNEAQWTAAALWAGYHTITVSYGGGGRYVPTVVILDPARLKIETIVDSRTNRGKRVTLSNGQQVAFRDLTPDEIRTQQHHHGYARTKSSQYGGPEPDLWNGQPRTQ